MNSDRIFEVIDSVANTSGNNDKESIVASHIADPQFQQVLAFAYNPLITYGVANIPGNSGGDGEFTNDTWLLLHMLSSRDLSGNAALDAIVQEMNKLSVKSAELLKRILRKDLRAGFGASTINKTKKGLIPVFPYMRCSLTKQVKLSAWPWHKGVISQEKADGMFANVDHETGGNVSIRSRQGSEFPLKHFASFIKEVQERISPNTQTHGEFLVTVDGEIQPRQISNGIMNHLLDGGELESNQQLAFFVWDQIPLDSVVSKGRYSVSYSARLARIIGQLNSSKDRQNKCIGLIPTRVVYSLGDAYSHFAELLKLSKEGTVIKNPDGHWRDGTSKDQVKLKLDVDVDLKITDIVPGRDGTKNENRPGSMTCVTSCGLLKVDVTVKNEAMRDQIEANPNDWIGRVIVVRSNSILDPSESNEFYTLFLPRMAETSYRVDKTEPDSLEQVRDQFAAAIETAIQAAKIAQAA